MFIFPVPFYIPVIVINFMFYYIWTPFTKIKTVTKNMAYYSLKCLFFCQTVSHIIYLFYLDTTCWNKKLHIVRSHDKKT